MPGFATRAIRAAGRTPDAPQPPVNVPIYQTSTFEVSSALELAELLAFARPGHSYSRYSNPTHAALEDALAVQERPNVPGTTKEFPNWRLALPATLDEIEEAEGPRRIASAMEAAGRANHRPPRSRGPWPG